jgi:SAM-dependent methyltransferase
LNERDLRSYIERYEKRLEEFGYSPETLGWGTFGRQEVRFAVLAESILKFPSSSVLDVGCGFADLYVFLRQRGWHGRYVGIDLVPGLLRVARERSPGLDLREIDITSEGAAGTLGRHDFVVSSGALNARLEYEENAGHIMSALKSMHDCARIAVAVDFLSTYVDFQKPGSWHTDPAWAFGVAKKLSRRVALRHDYMPFEFALIIYCDDSIGERNVFGELREPR